MDFLPTGLTLRDECADDKPFLERLFVSTREAEPGFAALPQEMRYSFLCSQFEFQSRHYANAYAGGDFHIVEHDDCMIGRLYLFHTHQDIRVIDISLTPAYCGGGLGSLLLGAVQQLAASQGKTVSLNVEMHNPAQRLYSRLGFQCAGQSGPYWQMIWPGNAADISCIENRDSVG